MIETKRLLRLKLLSFVNINNQQLISKQLKIGLMIKVND